MTRLGRLSVTRATGFSLVTFLMVLGQVLAILALAVAMEWCAPREAIAGQRTARCNLVSDHDRRHLCRALALRSQAECAFIRSPDRRHYCRALVRGTPSDCGFIRDDDMRRECRDLAQG